MTIDAEADNDKQGTTGERASRSFWPAAGWILLYGLIFQVVELVLALVVLLQLGALLFTGRAHPELLDFGGRVLDYAVEVLEFLLQRSDARPWPFDGPTRPDPAP